MTPEQIKAARELRAAGTPWRKIAAIVGVDTRWLRINVVEGERERSNARRAEWRKQWTEEARERNRARQRRYEPRADLRRQARAEAAQTGEDVRAIYARWDVLSARDTRP